MSVASWSGSLLEWEGELTALKARLASVFGRAELRASASGFIDRLATGRAGWAGTDISDPVIAGAEQLGRGGIVRAGA